MVGELLIPDSPTYGIFLPQGKVGVVPAHAQYILLFHSHLFSQFRVYQRILRAGGAVYAAHCGSLGAGLGCTRLEVKGARLPIIDGTDGAQLHRFYA